VNPLFTFLITSSLVERRTGDAARGRQLGLLTALMPGNAGMMLGVVLASAEPAPVASNPKPDSAAIRHALPSNVTRS
jgi:hypothetical protein